MKLQLLKSNNDRLSINRYKVIQHHTNYNFKLQLTKKKKKSKQSDATSFRSLTKIGSLFSITSFKHFSNFSQHRTTVPLSALEIGTRSHVPLPEHEARFLIWSHRKHIQTRSNRVQSGQFIHPIYIYIIGRLKEDDNRGSSRNDRYRSSIIGIFRNTTLPRDSRNFSAVPIVNFVR